MKKIALLTLVVVFTVGMIFAGGGKDSESESESSPQEPQVQEGDGYYPVTIKTHNRAREEIEVTFYKAPERLLVYGLNSIENLIELGLEDKVLYATNNEGGILPRYQEAADRIPEISRQFVSKEKALEMQPDFIYAWYGSFGDTSLGDVDFWHERNINTYMAYNSGLGGPNNLENEYSDILNLGKIFNMENEAQAIIDKIKTKIIRGQEYLKDQEAVDIVIVEDEGNVFRVYGEDTIGGDIAMQVGANLLAKDRSVKLSAEDLIQLNPDMIFSVHFGETATTLLNPVTCLDVFKNNPAYENLDAVKNGNLYPTELSYVYSPGVRVLDSLDFFLEKLYPDME